MCATKEMEASSGLHWFTPSQLPTNNTPNIFRVPQGVIKVNHVRGQSTASTLEPAIKSDRLERFIDKVMTRVKIMTVATFLPNGYASVIEDGAMPMQTRGYLNRTSSHQHVGRVVFKRDHWAPSMAGGMSLVGACLEQKEGYFSTNCLIGRKTDVSAYLFNSFDADQVDKYEAQSRLPKQPV